MHCSCTTISSGVGSAILGASLVADLPDSISMPITFVFFLVGVFIGLKSEENHSAKEVLLDSQGKN